MERAGESGQTMQLATCIARSRSAQYLGPTRAGPVRGGAGGRRTTLGACMGCSLPPVLENLALGVAPRPPLQLSPGGA